MKNYFIRINPLIDFNQIQDVIDDDFEKDWNDESLLGYEKTIKEINEHLNINEIEDDIEISKKNLRKDNDSNANLFCSVCCKLFSNENILKSHLNGKNHIKKAKNQSVISVSSEMHSSKLQDYYSKEQDVIKGLAYEEYQINRFRELLNEHFNNTVNLIRKKQTLSHAEMEAEKNNDIIEETKIGTTVLEDNSDDEKPIYNPKNIPLGWDGKPIPYWLYKLHELGKEYKCEICGNASYWGRKAFERHFQEWRHSYGMKCLKIPNTVHFKEVTSIEDALNCKIIF